MIPKNSAIDRTCERLGISPIRRLGEKDSSWLCRDTDGKLFVLKTADRSQDPHTILRALRVLYTPFKYPIPLTAPGDSCLVYPWIEGERMDRIDPSEQERHLDEIIELAGRIQALLRSLHLVPFFEKSFSAGDDSGARESNGTFTGAEINFGCSPVLDQEIKKARRYEVAASYKWLNDGLSRWWDTIVKNGIWHEDSMERFRKLLDASPAIHLPITGNNLAHGRFTPDHIILCPDGSLGVVSWRVDPRPRRYMQLSFLAWSLFHESRTGIYEKFSTLIPRFFARSFYLENLLVLNVCILEQGYYFASNGHGSDCLADEKFFSANRILSEGLYTLVANMP